jgi:LCP family protein required for cell wall assembly
MTDHDIEVLVRQAVADEASTAVDAGTVLAGLRQGRSRRRRPIALIAAAGLAVAAVAVAVVVPVLAGRDAPPPPSQQVARPAPMTAQNILLIGLDERANTDAVVLLRLGGDGVLNAVSLPRDSLVDIPGLGHESLNSAYPVARQSAVDRGADEATAAAEGAKSLVATVEQLTGVEVDHYAAVEMAGLGRISSAVGGVEVCLREPSQDSFSGADFPAGRKVLTGDQALAFVRQRHDLPQGDLDRVVRQQAFLKSLAAKVIGDPQKLTAALAAVRDNVRVDQGWDVAAFASGLASGVSTRTATIPVNEQSGGPGLVLDPAAVRTFVGEFLAGPAPSTQPPSGTPAQGELPCVN